MAFNDGAIVPSSRASATRGRPRSLRKSCIACNPPTRQRGKAVGSRDALQLTAILIGRSRPRPAS